MSKAKRIIITVSSALNTVFWLWASVYEFISLTVKNEQIKSFEGLIGNTYLVVSVMGFVNAILLLIGIILYQKTNANEMVFICPLLLYLCPIGIMILTYGLYVLYPLVFAFPFIWAAGVITGAVLIIIGFMNNKKVSASGGGGTPTRAAKAAKQ